MPENSGNNFVGIEVATRTMRAVVISSGGEVLTHREAPYQPEDLVPEVQLLILAAAEVVVVVSS